MQQNNPLVSILLAVYNDEKYIYKSVKSIIDQTYNNWELLIGFNGTIDKSKDIINSFNDERIRVFDYGDDKGKAKTLNKLTKEAKGDWLAIQDGDDMWFPKKLNLQLEFINDYDIIGTQIIYINEADEVFGSAKISNQHDEIVYNCLRGVNHIANTSAIFKKEKAVESEFWDETIDGIEDYDFWLKMITKASCRCINLNKYLVWHRVHKMSNFNTKKYDIEGLVEKYNKI